jgi:hypothetical protein
MTKSTHNVNPLRKHCLEVAILSSTAILVTLDAIGGTGRKIATRRIPITSPRTPQAIASSVLHCWRPVERGLDTDAARLPHFAAVCDFNTI